MVTKITANSFKQEVLDAGKKTVLDFYADWCGPCKMIAPAMESLSEKHSEWKFCKVNVDEAPELAAKFAVSAIPMVAVFENGQLLDSFVGFREEKETESFIQSC